MVGVEDPGMFELAREQHLYDRQCGGDMTLVRAFRRPENEGADRSGIIGHNADTIAWSR